MKNTTNDRLLYSESVKVNIGDYESRDVHISYSSDINKDESFDDAYKRVSSMVKKKLYVSEKKIRESIRDNVDYDVDYKMRYFKVKK